MIDFTRLFMTELLLMQQLSKHCSRYHLYQVVLLIGAAVIVVIDVYILLPMNLLPYRDLNGHVSTGDWWAAFFKTIGMVTAVLLIEAGLIRCWFATREHWVCKRTQWARFASFSLNTGFLTVFVVALFYLFHLGYAATLPELQRATETQFMTIGVDGQPMVSEAGEEWIGYAIWSALSLVFSALASALLLAYFHLMRRERKDWVWLSLASDFIGQIKVNHDEAIVARKLEESVQQVFLDEKLRLRVELMDAISSGLHWLESRVWELKHGFQPTEITQDNLQQLKYLESILHLSGIEELEQLVADARANFQKLDFIAP